MAGHSRPKDGVASARLCPGHDEEIAAHVRLHTVIASASEAIQNVSADDSLEFFVASAQNCSAILSRAPRN